MLSMFHTSKVYLTNEESKAKEEEADAVHVPYIYGLTYQ